MPDDTQITSRIEKLELESEALRHNQARAAEHSSTDAQRLDVIRIEVDRLWDLLRQRRAPRSAGRNPNDANERSSVTVEGYWQ
jgi:hypothetical protein